MSNQQPGPTRELSIDLTLVKDAEGRTSLAIKVQPAQMITYEEQTGFTRLRLTGGRVLEVKEGAAQIDRLIRSAATNFVRQ